MLFAHVLCSCAQGRSARNSSAASTVLSSISPLGVRHRLKQKASHILERIQRLEKKEHENSRSFADKVAVFRDKRVNLCCDVSVDP